MAAETWNPLQTDTSNITLSGGNLIATSSTGGIASTFGTVAYTAGQYYWELVLTDAAGFADTFFGMAGIGNSSVNPSGYHLSGDANSAGFTYNSSTIAWYDVDGNEASFAASVPANGDNWGIALDIGNKLIYLRINGGNWNGSASNNPVTQTGGFNMVNVTLGAGFSPGVTVGNVTGTSVTAKFTSASWTHTAPNGFVSLSPAVAAGGGGAQLLLGDMIGWTPSLSDLLLPAGLAMGRKAGELIRSGAKISRRSLLGKR